MRIAALVVGLTLWLGAGEARAQFICANFWPQSSGTYADLLMVTVTGNTTTASQNGITGLRLGGNAATTCTSYALSQNVARFDFERLKVAGVSVSKAARVNPGARSSIRAPKRTSWRSISSQGSPR